MNRGFWLAGAAILMGAGLASAASAAPASPGSAGPAQDISLTVYNSNLVLVEEHRPLDLPAGKARVEFKGVSAAIRPETVSLAAPGTEVVEQNFDYDLLTPAKLMEKAVGRQVKIVRFNPGANQQVTETATVLSVNGGVVLKIGDRIEVLHDDGVPTRVIFDSIPDNLRPQPTLSITVDSAQAGKRDARLSYLSTGMSWRADYVALFDEAKGALDLTGWVTLTNQSGTDFQDAETRVIAGAVSLVRSEAEWFQIDRQRSRTGAPGSRPGGGAGSIADYHVYPLPGRITVANNQTKQVGLIDAAGVPAQKRYAYERRDLDSQAYPDHVDVTLDFTNRNGAGALPLPSGLVRVYVRDAAGDPKFVGENPISHTAVGGRLSVKTGEAFDVTVQGTLQPGDKTAVKRGVSSMSYSFHNARAEPVTVQFRQGDLSRAAKVLTESQAGKRVDAETLEWDVAVPAGGDSELTFTLDVDG